MNLMEHIPSAVALFSAIYAGYCQSKVTRMTADFNEMSKKREAEARIHEVMRLYKVPLANAAYDLQSRLYNMVARQFIQSYYKLDQRHQDYVIHNTMFLIAQYFSWTEIIRREVKHLDSGDAAMNQKMATLRDSIYSHWQSERHSQDRFHIFAGEQRAIGEQLIVGRGERSDCMGYWDFLRYLENGSSPSMLALKADVVAICEDPKFSVRGRFIRIQNALIDMIDFLDPQYQLFPKKNRSKILLT